MESIHRDSIGALDRRVKLRRPTYETKASGEKVPTYFEDDNIVATVWAAVEPIGGQKMWKEMQTQPDATHVVTLRYRTDVQDDWAVEHEGRIFMIRLRQEKGRRVGLILYCSERADGVRGSD